MTDPLAVGPGRSAPPSQPDACSVLWDKAEAGVVGTAPLARFWVALEQNGPWGAQAATQSHLDPDLGTSVDTMCKAGAGRFILIRRPGRHADRRPDNLRRLDPLRIDPQHIDPHIDPQRINPQQINPQRVYIAGGLASRPWLLQADLDDPGRLTRLGLLSSLAPLGMGGTEGALGLDALRDALPELQPSPDPVLMICTNSRRDVCCSLRGRPVAAESVSRRPGQVWECSHTGGHRFAPTGVLLPYGQTFGRLSASSAVAAVDAGMRAEIADQLLGATHDRGRSHLDAPEQAAESLVREQIREHRLLALTTTTVTRGTDEDRNTAKPSGENPNNAKPGGENPNAAKPGGENPNNATRYDKNRDDASSIDAKREIEHRTEKNTWTCKVSHADGRQWEVTVVRGPSGATLPESCGKEPVPGWRWSVLGDAGRPILAV